jgi:hypothetical protein
MMPDIDYLAHALVAFVIPIHPGVLPIHLAAATSAQIATTTNRQYDANIAAHIYTILPSPKHPLPTNPYHGGPQNHQGL